MKKGTALRGRRAVCRIADMQDVEEIVKLERRVWGKTGADTLHVETRMQTFPEGNFVIVCDDRIVGYVVFQYVDDLRKSLEFTWEEITDRGMIKQSHKPEGKFIYGVNMSVDPLMRQQKFGTHLILQGWCNMVINNKRGAFIGSRIPGYRSYLEHNPGTTVEEYTKLRRDDGKLFDPELRLYESEGLQIARILPGYFPDPESMDYGVLVYRQNPFRDWPAKRSLAWLITSLAPKFIRGSIALTVMNGQNGWR